jgi:hypothetical protein
MHKIPIAAAAALAMLTVAAFTGLATTPDQPGALAQATPGAPAAREPAVNPLPKGDVPNIEGTIVYGDDGKLGYVSTVVIDLHGLRVDRLVVSVGGVLGIGGHRVAIPADQFKWEADKGAFRLMNETTASLRSMPEWVEGADTATGSSQPPQIERPAIGAGDGDKTSK